MSCYHGIIPQFPVLLLQGNQLIPSTSDAPCWIWMNSLLESIRIPQYNHKAHVKKLMRLVRRIIIVVISIQCPIRRLKIIHNLRYGLGKLQSRTSGNLIRRISLTFDSCLSSNATMTSVKCQNDWTIQHRFRVLNTLRDLRNVLCDLETALRFPNFHPKRRHHG